MNTSEVVAAILNLSSIRGMIREGNSDVARGPALGISRGDFVRKASQRFQDCLKHYSLNLEPGPFPDKNEWPVFSLEEGLDQRVIWSWKGGR